MVQPASLPLQPGRLIGREREMQEVAGLLVQPGVRLVTLVGRAGVGKTRLAVAAANEVAEVFVDGAFFVDLAPISEADLVPAQIAQALGVREMGPQPLAERLQQALREQHVLLLLDNFEQVIDAAGVVARLLETCPTLSLLATSREALRIRWEHLVAVSPLPVPSKRGRRDPERLVEAAAAELFVERAQAVTGQFDVTAETAPLVADVCERLDGLPLAIELAAGRTSLLPLSDLARRLERRLDFLTSGARDLPTRHQTLRAAIDWSYELLAPGEQALFRRLGIFVGGFSLSAAEAVAPEESADVFASLVSLVQKSLVQRELDDSGEARFSMLEMVREYARERLVEEGELEEAERRRAEYYVEFAERAEEGFWGPEQLVWQGRVEREFGNMRAAVEWSVASGNWEIGQRIASAPWAALTHCGYLTDVRLWLATLSEEGALSPIRAKALRAQGYFACLQSDLRCIEYLEASAMLARSIGDDRSLAWSLAMLGMSRLLLTAEIEQSAAEIDESLRLHGANGEYGFLVGALLWKAELLRVRGQLDEAKTRLLEVVALARSMGDPWTAAFPLYNLGLLALSEGNTAHARDLFVESLLLRIEANAWFSVATCIEGLAFASVAEGKLEVAGEYFGAAESLAARFGARPLDLAAGSHQEWLERARALDQVAFERGWARGRSMSQQDVVSYALGDAAHPQQHSAGSDGPASLTQREIDVLRAIVAGKSDAEIARELIISVHTVHGHVRNILSKTGLENRTQAAIFARDSGLIGRSPGSVTSRLGGVSHAAPGPWRADQLS